MTNTFVIAARPGTFTMTSIELRCVEIENSKFHWIVTYNHNRGNTSAIKCKGPIEWTDNFYGQGIYSINFPVADSCSDLASLASEIQISGNMDKPAADCCCPGFVYFLIHDYARKGYFQNSDGIDIGGLWIRLLCPTLPSYPDHPVYNPRTGTEVVGVQNWSVDCYDMACPYVD